LRAAGESDAAQRAHAGYFAARIEDDERHVAAKRTWWVARCDEDLPNLRAALQWAMGGDVETGLRISGGLGTYWYLSGRLNEGMRWLRDLLALAGGEHSPVGVAVRAKALYMAGWIACDQGRSRDAVALLDACVALRRRRGSRASLIEALQRLAGASQQYGDLARAERILRACLAYHRRAGDVAATLLTLNALSNVAYERGADAASEDQLREALPIARAHGDAGWTVLFLVKLGRFAHARGDCSGANALFEEGARLACAASADQPPLMLLNLAYVARELGRLGEARAYCETSLARYRAERHEDGVAFASLVLGAITVDQGDLRAAGACYAEALSLYERLSVQHALADCFEGIASLKVASRAQLGAAAMLCGAAATLRDVNGSPLSRRESAAHERTLAALRDLLGADTYLSARATGASLALDDALALARSTAHADEAVEVHAGNPTVEKLGARR
jgi:tetratricopeptide (TPR) repeat protein